MYNFEQIAEMYENMNNPAFRIKNLQDGFTVGSNLDPAKDKATSWALFERWYSLLPDGLYEVVFKTSPSSPDAHSPKYRFAKGEQPPTAAGQISGVPAAAGSYGMTLQQYQTLQATHRAEVDTLKERIAQLEKEAMKAEFEQKIEGLKAEQNGGLVSILSGIADKHLPAILGAFMPTGTGAAAVGIAGAPNTAPRQTEAADPGILSIDELVSDAQELAAIFPDQNINDIFRRLVNFCQTQPDIAKQFLNQL